MNSTAKKNSFARIVEFTSCQVLLTRGKEDNKHTVVITVVLDTDEIKETFGYLDNTTRDAAWHKKFTRAWLVEWVLNQKADRNCKQHYANAN